MKMKAKKLRIEAVEKQASEVRDIRPDKPVLRQQFLSQKTIKESVPKTLRVVAGTRQCKAARK